MALYVYERRVKGGVEIGWAEKRSGLPEDAAVCKCRGLSQTDLVLKVKQRRLGALGFVRVHGNDDGRDQRWERPKE